MHSGNSIGIKVTKLLMNATTVKCDDLYLGFDEMDRTHQEFMRKVVQLTSASKEEFMALFSQFLQHTQEHFEQEHEWMQSSKFPALADHVADHMRVLNELRQLQPRVEKGSLALARGCVAQLPNWFNLHVHTMDAALANYLYHLGD